MSFNPLGLIAAITAFLSIWIGHVAVRKIEASARTLWMPSVIAFALGISLEYWSLSTDNLLLKTALGIIGITLLWDALEFTRQQDRVKKGRAPANPDNPRHAMILADYPSATTLDLLKRDPTGQPVAYAEAVKLVNEYRFLKTGH